MAVPTGRSVVFVTGNANKLEEVAEWFTRTDIPFRKALLGTLNVAACAVY